LVREDPGGTRGREQHAGDEYPREYTKAHELE
jgi:hypothetical protein